MNYEREKYKEELKEMRIREQKKNDDFDLGIEGKRIRCKNCNIQL